MYLIIYPDVDIWNYTVAGLQARKDIALYPLNRYCNLFQQATRKFIPNSKLPANWVLGSKLRSSIISLSSMDSIVLCEYSEPILIEAIASICPKDVKCCLWLWNHIDIRYPLRDNISYIRKSRFEIKTYDEYDADQYGISWHNQFFDLHRYDAINKLPTVFKYDFVFIGYSKNRIDTISQIQKELAGFRCSFTIVNSSSEYVRYEDYMERVRYSRCLVEVVHEGDRSCTLRPLEALSMHRKLLTNNTFIRNYSFYHPDNIFVIGQDDITNLSSFLETPLVPIPAKVLESYDIHHWIDSFK